MSLTRTQKVIFFGGGMFIIIGIAWYMTQTTPLRNTPPRNETIVVFGDSLVEGVGATVGHDVPNVLAQKLGRTVYNVGKSGDTTAMALLRVHAALETNAGVAVVVLGGNDFLQKVDRAQTFANLRKIVKTFQESGMAVIIVGVQDSALGDGAGKAYQALADDTQSLYVPSILHGLFGDTRYMFDTIHPNDAGYAIIADRIAEAVRQVSR